MGSLDYQFEEDLVEESEPSDVEPYKKVNKRFLCCQLFCKRNQTFSLFSVISQTLKKSYYQKKGELPSEKTTEKPKTSLTIHRNQNSNVVKKSALM